MLLPLFVCAVLLPLFSIALLWRRPRRPLVSWLSTLILALGLTGFGLLVAPWGWFGIPLRAGIGLLFLAALVISLRRPLPDEPRQESLTRSMLKVLIGFFFGSAAVGVLAANAVPPGALDVAFPLTGGRFLVAHGGSTSAANMHAQHPQQRYALDLVKINRAGLRAKGIYPKTVDRYEIWNDPIVAPCDGSVAAAVDGLPDQRPGMTDIDNVAGNHVVLRCGEITVLLAHMQRGSVGVRPGTAVRRGTFLGRAGNSGNTTEPHLHIHAERQGEAVPLTFNGEWLVRNEVVTR